MARAQGVGRELRLSFMFLLCSCSCFCLKMARAPERDRNNKGRVRECDKKKVLRIFRSNLFPFVFSVSRSFLNLNFFYKLFFYKLFLLPLLVKRAGFALKQ